jgi:hypothetical protein
VSTGAQDLPRSGGNRPVISLWPLCLLIGGILLVALRQSDYFRAIPGDLADARFNNLILEHLFRWVTGKDSSLWSPGFYYPYKGVLAFSDNHFGSGAIYILLRLLGCGPDLAFIGWYTFAFPLNYLCCYYALRKMGLSVPGSAVGAFIFSFTYNVSAQAGHAQLGYRFAIPLATLAWRHFAESANLRQLAVLVFWVVVQFYCSIYMGYFLLLLLIGYFIAQLLLCPDAGGYRSHSAFLRCLGNLRPRHDAVNLFTIVACLVALAVMLYPYLHYSRLYGFQRDYAETQTMLPRLKSYFLADEALLWGKVSLRIKHIPMRWEHQMFWGLGAWVLMITALLRARNHRNMSALIALIFMIVLTVSWKDHSLYTLIHDLPLANAIRAVARIGIVMDFPVAILAAGGFDWLMFSSPRRRLKMVAAMTVVALTVVEYATYTTNRVSMEEWRERLATLVARVSGPLPGDAIIYVPERSDERPFLNELDGMNLAQVLDRNTLNGYSGNWPVGFPERDLDPCFVVNNRLSGYAVLMGLGYADYAALVKRVVVIGSDVTCQPLSTLSGRTHFRGELPKSLIPKLVLTVDDVGLQHGTLMATLSIQNDSTDVLPSVSDDYRPARFSWRFVPIGTTMGENDNWVTRKDLLQDVPAGKTERFDIYVDPPSQSGKYHLEVTMVQENVMWFQNAGMPIAKSTQVIDVTGNGSIRVEN